MPAPKLTLNHCSVDNYPWIKMRPGDILRDSTGTASRNLLMLRASFAIPNKRFCSRVVDGVIHIGVLHPDGTSNLPSKYPKITTEQKNRRRRAERLAWHRANKRNPFTP